MVKIENFSLVNGYMTTLKVAALTFHCYIFYV